MIYDTPGKTFKGMADAIRQIEGSSAPIPVVEMPDRIRALQSTPLSIDISGKTSKNWIEELIPYVYIQHGVSNLNYMFSKFCRYVSPPPSPMGLADIDLSNFYLPSSVIRLASMFEYAKVNSIDFDNWDTRYVTSMIGMFRYCYFNKIWLPTSFTNSDLSNPPFSGCGENTTYYDFEIYTDSTEDRTQEWGININYLTVHYNSTHQDFLNA